MPKSNIAGWKTTQGWQSFTPLPIELVRVGGVESSLHGKRNQSAALRIHVGHFEFGR